MMFYRLFVCSTELMDQKHNLEDLMEKRLDLLTKTVNKRKRKRTDESSSVSDESQVSFALIEAEKLKVKVRKMVVIEILRVINDINTLCIESFSLICNTIDSL